MYRIVFGLTRFLFLVLFFFFLFFFSQLFLRLHSATLLRRRKQAEKLARAAERKASKLPKEPKYRRLKKCVDRRPMAQRKKDMEHVMGRKDGRPCACAKKLGITTYKSSTATRGVGLDGAETTEMSQIQRLAKRKPDACCGEDCLNKLLYIECTPENCSLAGVTGPDGQPVCKNMQLQRQLGKKLYTKPTPGKGWGLFAAEDIRAGDFVVEYVGEIFDDNQVEQRLMEYKEANEVRVWVGIGARDSGAKPRPALTGGVVVAVSWHLAGAFPHDGIALAVHH